MATLFLEEKKIQNVFPKNKKYVLLIQILLLLSFLFLLCNFKLTNLQFHQRCSHCFHRQSSSFELVDSLEKMTGKKKSKIHRFVRICTFCYQTWCVDVLSNDFSSHYETQRNVTYTLAGSFTHMLVLLGFRFRVVPCPWAQWTKTCQLWNILQTEKDV